MTADEAQEQEFDDGNHGFFPSVRSRGATLRAYRTFRNLLRYEFIASRVRPGRCEEPQFYCYFVGPFDHAAAISAYSFV